MAVSGSMALPIHMMPMQRPSTHDEKVKSAQEYEEMFIKFFFNKIMPKSEEGGYLGSSSNTEVYRSFWVDAAAKQAAKQGVGIAKQILRHMERADRAAEMALKNLMIHQPGMGEQHDQFV